MTMITYSITSLLELSEKVRNVPVSFPFLESFVGKYSQKVTEDKKVPLFSKTSKYNNFPVRCQWKGGNNEKSDNFDRRKERNYNDNYQKNKWRNKEKPSIEKLVPTKINKVLGIKGLAIKVLNKITENNFEKQSDELLKVLVNNKEKESVLVIANLVLEKIWYDKGFYELYVRLCKKLWENNEWITECYKIHTKSDKFFYSLEFGIKKSTLEGPFQNKKIAIDEAIKKCNFKSIFLALCRDNFYNREKFIEEASRLPDSSQKYKLKRRLFGTVEILGYLFNMNYLDDNIIHYIILSLLHTDSIHNNGAKHADELEAIKLLWDIVYIKIHKNEYHELFEKELVKKWGSRIIFMIEDMIDTILKDNKNDIKDSTKNTFVSQWKTKKLTFENKKDSKENKEENIKENKKLVKEFVILSRKTDTEKINNTIKNKNSDILISYISNIIKDLSEYGEHIENHINTILFLIKNKNLTFTVLSQAFAIAGQDIPDLKIDAPKAPKNISYSICKILEKEVEGIIKIDSTKIYYDYVDSDDIKYEWKNILKIVNTTSENKDIISRFKIL